MEANEKYKLRCVTRNGAGAWHAPECIFTAVVVFDCTEVESSEWVIWNYIVSKLKSIDVSI